MSNNCPIFKVLYDGLKDIEKIHDNQLLRKRLTDVATRVKNVAESVYGGFKMSEIYRENLQLKQLCVSLRKQLNETKN